jgi:asparagine synthase (glutamine-hydrolysing)
MCGIAGLVRFDAAPVDAAALVETMCAQMAHRGPDGGGVDDGAGVGSVVAAVSHAALGMRRLAIVDVENGRQPMTSDDGAITLVYNGEVYNASSLRQRLEGEGVHFRTKSDTEVILRLYERNPDDVEAHLAGMWAFAVHDRRRGRVVLSRDRFGIKPLFVVVAGASLAFASELGCFAPLRNTSFRQAFEVDDAAAQAMLAWSYVPGERTIFRGVKRLAPGSRLEMATTGTSSPSHRIYYRPRPDDMASRVRSLEEAAELTESVLSRAVREHLVSDVPVATFLSGGIDSSLVAAYAARASGRPLEAFTIGFESRAFDEAPAARFAAGRLGVPHHVEVLDEDGLAALVAPALLAYDEPFGDSSSIATFALCARVATGRSLATLGSAGEVGYAARHRLPTGYKVALGGDGGDEAFAGYRKHHAVAARALLDRAPRLREALGGTLRRLPGSADRSHWHTRTLRTLRRLGTGLAGDAAQSYAALTQVATLGDVAPLLVSPGGAQSFLSEIERLYAGGEGTALRRTLLADLGNVLPNDMLTKIDRASMASSLEARVPLLDHRVVEVGIGLPARFTLGRSGKEVLRLLCARAIGPEHARLPKRGFSVPIERWLTGRLGVACERLFARPRLERYGILSPETLSHGGWRALAHGAPQVLWNALALAVWSERHLGGDAAFVEDVFRECAPATRSASSAASRSTIQRASAPKSTATARSGASEQEGTWE